jgi:hypothetical protein
MIKHLIENIFYKDSEEEDEEEDITETNVLTEEYIEKQKKVEEIKRLIKEFEKYLEIEELKEEDDEEEQELSSMRRTRIALIELIPTENEEEELYLNISSDEEKNVKETMSIIDKKKRLEKYKEKEGDDIFKNNIINKNKIKIKEINSTEKNHQIENKENIKNPNEVIINNKVFF